MIQSRISTRVLLGKGEHQPAPEVVRNSKDEIYRHFAPIGARFEGRFFAWDKYAFDLVKKAGIKPSEPKYYKQPCRHFYDAERYDNWKNYTPDNRKANPRFLTVLLGIRPKKNLFHFTDIPREAFPRSVVYLRAKEKLAHPVELFSQEVMRFNGESVTNVDGSKMYKILAPKEVLRRFLYRLRFQGLRFYRKYRVILNQHLHMFATKQGNVLRSEDVESVLFEIAWLYGTSNETFKKRFGQYVRDEMKTKGQHNVHIVSLPSDVLKSDLYDVQRIRNGWRKEMMVERPEEFAEVNDKWTLGEGAKWSNTLSKRISNIFVKMPKSGGNFP